MSTIEFENKLYTCNESESVLNALIRGGAEISFSCRKGSCKACILHCKEGKVAEESQAKIHNNLKEKDYFLPCLCYLKEDNHLVLEKVNQSDIFKQAVVVEKKLISENECNLTISFLVDFDCTIGQTVNLWKDSDKFSTYNIINLLEVKRTIEITIANDSEISKWVFDELQIGDFIEVQGPYGETKENPSNTYDDSDPEHTEEPHVFQKPDLEMWAALDNGVLLRTILVDFYTDVYNDELLAPFFAHTHVENSVQKQYNFLYQTFTGEDVFFGHFPRNGHHWMIISDELFDYREKLIISKLEKYNLPKHLIERWVKMENVYRKQIVKNKPWNKIAFGVEFPPDGYNEVTLDMNLVCDSCEREVFSGETVKFHTRLGKIYCSNCQAVPI